MTVDLRYRVVADCAYVKMSDSAGASWRLLDRGALVLGGDTPNLQHLLDNNMIEPIEAAPVSVQA